MGTSGIEVDQGVLTIGNGVSATGNGNHGLYVTGGEAIINVTTGAPTTFNANGEHGIYVSGTGFVDLTGAVTGTNPCAGTIETNANVAAGVWIQQSASASAANTNLITGLVSCGATNGNGMRIVPGSFVSVNGSVFLDNSGNGVIVGDGTNDRSIAGINLGNSSAAGDNTFQAPAGSGNNGGVGICLDVPNPTGVGGGLVLQAVGNQFSATNCATTAGELFENTKGCSNDVAACQQGTNRICDLGLANPSSTLVASDNTFNASMCTLP
jgi:hypothetical protein